MGSAPVPPALGSAAMSSTRVVEQQRPQRRAGDGHDQRHDDDGDGEDAEEEEELSHAPVIGVTDRELNRDWTAR